MTTKYVKDLFVATVLRGCSDAGKLKNRIRVHVTCDTKDHFKMIGNVFFDDKMVYTLDIDKIIEEPIYLELFAEECLKNLKDAENTV